MVLRAEVAFAAAFALAGAAHSCEAADELHEVLQVVKSSKSRMSDALAKQLVKNAKTGRHHRNRKTLATAVQQAGLQLDELQLLELLKPYVPVIHPSAHLPADRYRPLVNEVRCRL